MNVIIALKLLCLTCLSFYAYIELHHASGQKVRICIFFIHTGVYLSSVGDVIYCHISSI